MVFQRIYSVQDDFFSSWSNDMAYVLGWIYSDGTLRKGTNATRIASTDYEILDLIKSLISWSGSIKAYPDPRRCKQCYEMMFSSKQIRQDLDRLGLVPNKSNIVTFPIVPIPSLSHFIRGY